MSELRNVQITGDAMNHYRSSGTRRKSRRKQSLEGGDSPPGQSISTAANFTAARAIQTGLATGGSKKPSGPLVITKTPHSHTSPPLTQTPVKEKEVKTVTPTPPALPVPAGKITLKPPKKTPKKILLAPPVKKNKLQKPIQTRKVRVHLQGFNKRITRAKDSCT